MDTKASDILLAMNTGSVQTIDQSPEGGEQRAPSSAYAIDVGEFNLFRDDMRKNTVMLVSHSMEDIARIADRILVMSRGEKAMFGKTSEVFSRGHELETMGLRVPQVTKIMMMLKEKGLPVNTDILTVEQAFNEILSLTGI